MKSTIFGLVVSAFLVEGAMFAQQARHPDLSGVWSYAIDRAPAALKKEVGGKVTIQKIDQRNDPDLMFPVDRRNALRLSTREPPFVSHQRGQRRSAPAATLQKFRSARMDLGE